MPNLGDVRDYINNAESEVREYVKDAAENIAPKILEQINSFDERVSPRRMLALLIAAAYILKREGEPEGRAIGANIDNADMLKWSIDNIMNNVTDEQFEALAKAYDRRKIGGSI